LVELQKKTWIGIKDKEIEKDKGIKGKKFKFSA
jgi:hypothetical protein